MKRILFILAAALCLTSCATTGGGSIRLRHIKWPEWDTLAAGEKALEAEAGPCDTKDTAMLLAEYRVKCKVAELVSGVSLAQSQILDNTYFEDSGVVLVNREEYLTSIVSAVETYVSRVETRTNTGEYQGKWYAKSRAVFTREWEERETARLEGRRADIQAELEDALAKARKRIEDANRYALAARRAVDAPARQAMEAGHDYYNQKRYKDAIDSYSAAVRFWESKKLTPPSEVYMYIGHAYFKLGNYRYAQEAYKDALKIDPGNVNARGFLENAQAEEKAAPERAKAAVKAEKERLAEEKKAEWKNKWESYLARARGASAGYGLSLLLDEWDAEHITGLGMELDAHFAPLPFITVGGGGFLIVEYSSSSNVYGGALLNAGLQIPLVSGNNENFQLKAFADGLLALGHLPYPGLFPKWKWAVPGYAGGLRFTWLENTPGEPGMGFELKYRGFLFADNRYLHSIGAGIVAAW